jgi:crotonobetainyl-CoA:carnitine CoA-transferase CaiB-like acyl-CoA transferase
MKVESENRKPGPLDGIKIVEYGVFHAGPGGGAILGDLGAEIIKIETEAGDPERFWTHVAGIDMSLSNGESLMYEVSNRNKKGLCLDIKTEQGRMVFQRLIRGADVFLTNLRKSTKKKLGIDYDTLKQINPTIIHANVSGYGPEGPMDNIGAFDPLGQACSGLMFVTGSGQPALMHLGVLDQATAISLSHAVITALFDRERRGIGQEVHVSLYGTALWIQHPNMMLSNVLNIDPNVTSDRSKHSPLRNAFLCGDNQWILGTHHPEEKYWKTFCEITEMNHLYSDPNFTDPDGKPKNHEALVEIYDRVFLTRTRDEWMELFLAHFLMFCPIQHIRDVVDDPQVTANRYIESFDYPGIGHITVPGYPIHFSECDAGLRHAAPAVGEHTDMILKDAGFDEAEIEQLKKDRIVK